MFQSTISKSPNLIFLSKTSLSVLTLSVSGDWERHLWTNIIIKHLRVLYSVHTLITVSRTSKKTLGALKSDQYIYSGMKNNLGLKLTTEN